MKLHDDKDFATACRELAVRCKSGFIAYPITTLALVLLSPVLRESSGPSVVTFIVFSILLVTRSRLCQEIIDRRGNVSAGRRLLFDVLTITSAVLWSIYIAYIGVIGEPRTVYIALFSSIGLAAGAVTSLAADHRLFLRYLMGITLPGLAVLWYFHSHHMAIYASAYLALSSVIVLVNRNMCRIFWQQVRAENAHLNEMQELREAVEQAEKLRTLGVLAGGVAHDFNNFLTSFVGNVDLALLELDNSSPAHEYLEEAKRLAFDASVLCEQLLAYAGRAESRIENFSLNDLVLQTDQLLYATVGQNVDLQIDLEENVPAVLGDPNQIRQVLLNLFVNSVESMPNTNGVIRVATSVVDQVETVPAQEEGKPKKFLCLTVADEGSGMSREVVEKIYDPFFTTKFTGRGLGLASVHGIIRGHGGKITVWSAPGAGTTFQVFLPVPEASQDPVPHLPQLKPTESGSSLPDTSYNRRAESPDSASGKLSKLTLSPSRVFQQRG